MRYRVLIGAQLEMGGSMAILSESGHIFEIELEVLGYLPIFPCEEPLRYHTG
jgi:hypothetical protein